MHDRTNYVAALTNSVNTAHPVSYLVHEAGLTDTAVPKNDNFEQNLLSRRHIDASNHTIETRAAERSVAAAVRLRLKGKQ
jgi:hypothetical protein